MADGVGPLGGEGLFDRLGVGDVGHVEGHPRRQVVAGAARQVVEDRCGVAGCQDGINDVAPDKTRTAGDQNLHACLGRETGTGSRGSPHGHPATGIGMEAA